MKKILVFLVMLSLLGVMVFAVDQPIEGIVEGNLNVDLETTTLDYGIVIPGQDSLVQTTTFNVAADNNVDFDIEVKLTSDPDKLFENIYLESTITPDTYTDPLVLNTGVLRSFVDGSSGTAFDVTIDSVLKVPLAAAPVSATGVITYTITAAP